MKIRLAVAALLGGLTLFCWGGLSHMVLGLGDYGMKAAPAPPADQALVDAVKTTLPGSGLYFFPGMDQAKAKAQDPAAMNEWTERTKGNGHGIIVYQSEAYAGMNGQLLHEVIFDVFVALLAAVLLSCTLGCNKSYAGRVGFVTLLGLLVAYRPIQMCNWYGFPHDFTHGQILDGVLGFLVMGLVIAAIVKRKPEGGAAAA